MRLDAEAAKQIAAGELERLFEQRVAQFAQVSRLKRLYKVALRQSVPIVRCRRRDGSRSEGIHLWFARPLSHGGRESVINGEKGARERERRERERESIEKRKLKCVKPTQIMKKKGFTKTLKKKDI